MATLGQLFGNKEEVTGKDTAPVYTGTGKGTYVDPVLAEPQPTKDTGRDVYRENKYITLPKEQPAAVKSVPIDINRVMENERKVKNNQQPMASTTSGYPHRKQLANGNEVVGYADRRPLEVKPGVYAMGVTEEGAIKDLIMNGVNGMNEESANYLREGDSMDSVLFNFFEKLFGKTSLVDKRLEKDIAQDDDTEQGSFTQALKRLLGR